MRCEQCGQAMPEKTLRAVREVVRNQGGELKRYWCEEHGGRVEATFQAELEAEGREGVGRW